MTKLKQSLVEIRSAACEIFYTCFKLSLIFLGIYFSINTNYVIEALVGYLFIVFGVVVWEMRKDKLKAIWKNNS